MYGLLGENVVFIEGFFQDTLPNFTFEQVAVVRLDGDMYRATITSLEALYPKLSSGGFLIVDDDGAVPACRAGVHDDRDQMGIHDRFETIDWTGVYWRKGRG